MIKQSIDGARRQRFFQGLWQMGRWWMVVTALLVSVVGGAITGQAGDEPDRASIAGLPVIELPAAAGHPDTLAIILSGDGGWADLDKTFGEEFQKQGLSTVGFDCLKYFWKIRQPAEVSQMLERVIRHYLQAWHKKKVVLIGYSFGACWLPFLINRLPADLLEQIELCVLLSPSEFVNVEIHVMDWMSDERRSGALDVLPEALRISKPVLCVYGAEEDDAICPRIKGGNVATLVQPGGHHYNSHYSPVIESIFYKIRLLESGKSP